MAVANTVEAAIVATFEDRFSGPAARAFEQFRQAAQAGFSSFNIAGDLENQLAGVVAGIDQALPELTARLEAIKALAAEVTLSAIDGISPAVLQAEQNLLRLDQLEVATRLTLIDQASFDALVLRAELEALFATPITQVIDARPGSIAAFSGAPQAPSRAGGTSSRGTISTVAFQQGPTAVSNLGGVTFNIQGGLAPDRQSARNLARLLDEELRRVQQRRSP